MTNLEYIEEFFRKHNLNGKIRVQYSGHMKYDEYISHIIFENGDEMDMNDIIFDIESRLEPDVVEVWMESKKKNDISLRDWMMTDNHYMPKNIDRSSVLEYQKEVQQIIDDAKEKIDRMFEYAIESSEEDEDGDE